jgi:hypothetical protein
MSDHPSDILMVHMCICFMAQFFGTVVRHRPVGQGNNTFSPSNTQQKNKMKITASGGKLDRRGRCISSTTVSARPAIARHAAEFFSGNGETSYWVRHFGGKCVEFDALTRHISEDATTPRTWVQKLVNVFGRPRVLRLTQSRRSCKHLARHMVSRACFVGDQRQAFQP